MRTIRRAFCALALGPAAAYADFSWEIASFAGQAERTEAYDADVVNVQTDVASLSGTYYLDPVSDGSGPLALAAFLDPTTTVFVAVSNDEITTETGVQTFELETRSYTLGGIYVLPLSKWYAGGSYSSGEPDESPPPPPPAVVSADVDDTKYRLVAGKYFGNGATRLELSFERRRLETEQMADPCMLLCSASVENTFDTDKIDVMHVRRFRSATYVLFGGISRTESRISGTLTELITPGVGPPFTQTFDTEVNAFDAYAIGAEIYPVASVGVRLGYARAAGETFPDEDTVDVGVSWFFRRNVGLELTLSRVDPDEWEFFSATERAALRVIGRLR
jgi:hypothetical protein